MRKLSISLFVLLVAVQVFIGLSDLSLPLDTEPVYVSGNNKLVVENRTVMSRIYNMNEQKINDIYNEIRYGHDRERNIIAATVLDGDIYFIRQYTDASWELVKIEKNDAVVHMQSDNKDTGSMTITGLYGEDGVFWISTIGNDERAAVFEYDGSGSAEMKMLTDNIWPDRLTKAEYNGNLLYVTLENEALYTVTPGGEVSYAGIAEKPPFNPDTDVHTWFLYRKDTMLSVFIIWAAVFAIAMLAAVISKNARKIATRVTAINGAVLLIVMAVAVVTTFAGILYTDNLGTAVNVSRVVAPVALLVWISGIILLNSFSTHLTKHVSGMTRQMQDIADGRIDVKKVPSGKDELHDMGQAIQELGMSISINNYELDSVVRSYHRFVPQKLTELLQRANIGEVSLGDNRRITGNVGLFSVGNRADARAMLSDDEFVDFINMSLDMYQSSISDNNGCMISSGLRLSALETLFTDSALDGVRAGLDFLGQAQKISKKNLPAPQPLLILHRASFLYGIAGDKERLYPYLSSSELEFLGSFAEELRNIGVRIVATESYWNQIKNSGFTGRHIGFVSDDANGAYKLYEILDTYSVFERNIRINYDDRFQEALGLFYKNDFFLARNIFSSILRTCPDDGIVRWYMFACEDLFNAKAKSDVDYSLFGTNQIV